METPTQVKEPRPIQFNQSESKVVENEVQNLLAKGVIEKCEPSSNQYVSNIFVREKKDGRFRVILNLKNLNQSVEYQKFKMETLESIVNLIRPGCFMASLDLKDAYYSVPVAMEDRPFLRFQWEDTLYQFSCLPMGLTSAPRIFTKIMKPVLASLRLLGHTNAIYIDDLYLQGDNLDECRDNVANTERLLLNLGFTINHKKSAKHPSQQLVMLGFILDSESMTVRMTLEKAQRVKQLCQEMRDREITTIQLLAELIGKLCSSFPGAEFGPLYYRELESLKCAGLRWSRGDFSGTVRITQEATSELDWWIKNVECSCKFISHGEPSVVIESDASKEGWGATVKGGVPTGGRWTPKESELHINVLELTAAFFGLKCFCSDLENTHVRLLLDNSTAVIYINAMGGMKSHMCNTITKTIWQWCIERNLWITACHIPGATNVEADRASRVFNDRTEWMLDKEVFTKITSVLFKPEIDLFASRINAQLPNYVSWHVDPEAKFVDAFMFKWTGMLCYLFPPFSLIARCLQKLALERVEDALLIVPLWPTQPWFSHLIDTLVDVPRLLPNKVLSLPGTKSQTAEPVRAQLIACHCSSSQLRIREFHEGLQLSSSNHGPRVRGNSTVMSLKNGKFFVVKKRLIFFKHL